jgi:hypothetical protein
MSNQNWRTLAAVLAVVAALLAGGVLAAVLVPGSPAASATRSAIAGASATVSPSAAPSASVEASPSGSLGSPSPQPTPKPAPKASLTFLDLKLDATDDPQGHARSVTFTSDGAGPVNVKLASQTPQGTTHLCVIAGIKTLGCRNWASGTFKANALSGKVKWKITVRGVGIATPHVNLTVSFPSLKPSVKISHARFDGTTDADYNGIQARFVPRAAGKATVTAAWSGHLFVFELDLLNETSGSGNVTLPNQGPAPGTDQSAPVTAKETWRLVLRNSETGVGRTDMSATITWP